MFAEEVGGFSNGKIQRCLAFVFTYLNLRIHIRTISNGLFD